MLHFPSLLIRKYVELLPPFPRVLTYVHPAILILWTWVIYNQNKRLLSICIFAFVCEIAAVVTIEVLGLRHIDGMLLQEKSRVTGGSRAL